MQTITNKAVTPANLLTSLPWKLIHIQAQQCKQLLQGQLCCDIEQLNHEQVSFGCYCDQKGRTQSSFFIWPKDDGYNMIMHHSLVDDTVALLQKYGVFSKIEIHRHDNISIQGLTLDPNKAASLIEAMGHRFKQDQSLSIHNNTTLIRYPDISKQRYLIIAEPSQLSEIASQYELELDLNEQWQKDDIHLGLVHLEKNTHNQFTPPMLNYQQFDGFSLNKGCYLGQEIIARTVRLGKLKRHIHVISSNQKLRVGEMINGDHGNIGQIVSTHKKHTLQERPSYLALAIINDKDLEDLQVNTNKYQPCIKLDSA